MHQTRTPSCALRLARVRRVFKDYCPDGYAIRVTVKLDDGSTDPSIWSDEVHSLDLPRPGDDYLVVTGWGRGAILQDHVDRAWNAYIASFEDADLVGFNSPRRKMAIKWLTTAIKALHEHEQANSDLIPF